MLVSEKHIVPVAVSYIRVSVPLQTAYQQWIQFEKFPQFMHRIREVHQINGTHLYWKAEIGGKETSGRPKSPNKCLIFAWPGGVEV
jgi:uncharacterized membrane protein